EYRKYSPGTILHYKMIEDLFNRKEFEYYDLCAGNGLHKRLFSTGSIFCGDIYYCDLFSKYALILIIKFFLKYFSDIMKNIFEMLGVKEKVKKIVRKSSGLFKKFKKQ
ncbi:MAG: GNAT family N-acetyltransferase, partial [Candidatus Electrothrix sp. ATG2]|nr:GNAT family N-acetyltransferase [Candidatus Electrothrix sp. ATG2]